MQTLIPMDDFGVFVDKQDMVRVDSRFVAQFFEKRHDLVLRDIRNLDCSENFRLLNFEESTYINEQGHKQPCYVMTRDGFVFLAMGYRGQRAAQFKELYIRRFNEMEAFIKTLVSARQEFPLLTENIRLLKDDPKPYHFSNECDMLNRIVLGMTAKQFRIQHGIEKKTSIRPYLTQEQQYEDQVSENMRKGDTRDEAETAAARVAAPPGTSDHQTGLGADIVDQYYSSLSVDTVNVRFLTWLADNCADYGFVIRYPSDKVSITGRNEPWHVRYVGDAAARFMTEHNLCLEEFVALYQ